MAYDENKQRLVAEAFRLSELNLETETKLMIASDQRSTTLSGMLFVAVGFVAASYGEKADEWIDDLSLLIMGTAIVSSVYAARSIQIVAPGMKFSDFEEDLESHRDYSTVLSDLGRKYDKCSIENRKKMTRNSKFYNLSLWLAIVGFCIGLVPNAFQLVGAVSN